MLAASALFMGGAARLGAQRAPARGPEQPQPLLVIALRDLTFGTVLPGVPNTVTVHDHSRYGLFEIRGPAGAIVRIEFVLPDALVRDDNTSHLPVSFGAGQGFASFGRDSPGFGFNPHNPVITPLSSEGRLFIRMGGTAFPGLPQNGGLYRATIHLSVYDLGT